MTSKKIYTGFDLIKLIAAIGIVALHTKVPFLNILGRLGVPFFAIVSSILFFSHYQNLYSYKDQKAYLKKFCKRILLLYATWQVFYIPIAIYQFREVMITLKGISIKNIFIYLIDFIFPAVYNSQGISLTKDANGWGPSWYLLATIVAMPILVYLLRLFRERIYPVFFLGLLIEIYLILADEFGSVTHLSPIIDHTFLRLLIYFCLGYIIVKYYKKFESWSLRNLLLTSTILICCFVVENMLVHYFGGIYTTEEIITTVPTGFFLALVGMRIRPQLNHSVQIRNLSTFLYCFQIWPIFVFYKVFEILGWKQYHFGLFVIVMFVSLIAATVYEWCRKKYGWKFLRYMV